MHALFLSGLIAFGFQALASTAPTMGSITGVSNVLATSPVKILGGISGTCDTQDGVNTCNSCASTPSCATAPLCSCNPSQIYDSLPIHIGLNGGDNAVTACAASEDGIVLTKIGNDDATHIDFYWSTVCNMMGGLTCNEVATSGRTDSINLKIWFSKTSTCGTAPNVKAGDSDAVTVQFQVIAPPADNFNVFGTPNNDGLSDFKPNAADHAVTLESLQSTPNFPVLSYPGGLVAGVVVLSSKEGIDQATYQSSTPIFLALTDDGSGLVNNVIDHLDNDVPYYFRIGLQDIAGNIVQYYPDNIANGNYACLTATANPEVCPFAAIPTAQRNLK